MYMIQNMNNIKNSKNDFNLLKIFKLLIEEGNLTRVSERLGLSQPAVSHALNKLRQEFDDPLFVRSSKGLTLTPFAVDLSGKLFDVMASIDTFYELGKGKDLLDYKEVVKIGTTDYLEGVLFKGLAKKFHVNIPNCSIVTLNMKGAFPKIELERGDMDLAMSGYFTDLPSGYYQQTLFEDHFVCLIGKKNKIVKSNLSLEKYLECPHLLTTLTGDLDGVVDKALRKIKKTRNVSMAFSSFFTPSFAVGEGDFILTCLSKVADVVESKFNLKRYRVPIKVPAIKIVQVWHERTHRDQLHSWIRKEIKGSMVEP